MTPPRKPPAQRAFQGLVGRFDPDDVPVADAQPEPSPVVVPEPPKKRGRKPKHANETERKAADAQRKKTERATTKAQEIIDAHPDHLGSNGESSGGFGSGKIERMVAAQQKGEAAGLGTNRGEDELRISDRRRVSHVPVSADNDTSDTNKDPETDKTFVNAAMRQQGRHIRAWIRGDQPKLRCSQDHQVLADKMRDSKTKVYCRRCRKLLVDPSGKPVKGINPPNFSDAPKEEVNGLSSQ